MYARNHLTTYIVQELFKRLEYNDAVLSLVEELGQASEHALDLHDSFSEDQRIKQKAARDALIMQIYRCLTFLRSLTKSSMGTLQSKLPVASSADEVYAGTTRSCLPGTRVNLLREIEEWAFDPDGQRALVLYGAAGKGKSAVANAVAMRLRGAGIYAPFFAFDRTARNLEAYQLLPTLAVQLARRNQRYHDALCRIEVDDLSTRDIKDQSDQLVVGLLAGHSDFTPLVMIIDALDECPDEDATDAARSLRLATDRRALLETLSALITDDRLPPNLRLLITTRPDDDIRLYIAHPASPLAGNAPDDNWPPGEPFVIHAPAEVLAISISPDGEHIASGLKDSTVCVWDVMTGRQVGPSYEGHEDAVSAVAYSPNGEVIASASNDQQIGDALTGHTLQVYSVVFSPDGKRLASASNDCTVRLWDPTTGQQVGLNVDGHTKSVWSVAFSPNSHVLASGSEDGTVRLWDTATCQQLGEPLGGQHGGVTSVAYSRDGKHIMACTDDTTIRVWDIESRQQVHDALRGHGAWPISIAYSPDENLVASGAQEYSVRLWDLETECQVSEALEGHEDPVTAVAFSPDGSRIVSSSMDRTIRIWEIPSGQHKSRVEHQKRHDICLGVTLSPNGRHLASAMLDGTIVLWDVSTGKQIGDVLRGHEERVTSVSFSPDGRSLASGSFDCTVRLWDVDTGKQMGVVRRELSDVHRVNCVAFSPDGRHALSGSDYGSLRIWTTADRVATGFSGHIDTITVVVYSPDGKLLATGSRDRTVRVWDAVTGHQVVEALTGHVAAITCVSFSPDGGHIVSCGDDSTIRVWDTTTGKQIGHSLRGHCTAVDSVAFAPDGRTIVSSAANDSIRTWRTPDESGWLRTDTAYVLWVPRHLRRLQFASSPRHVEFIPPTHPHVAVDLYDAALGHDWAQIYCPAAESS
ncbi:WD40-repeat-containing domain protein [Schizophyllum commune]